MSMVAAFYISAMNTFAKPLVAMVLCVLGVAAAQAQDVLDKISKDMCPCLDKYAAEESLDSLKVNLGVCMIKYGIDLNHMDKGDGERLGQVLALRLISQCPSFTGLAMRMAKEDDEPPPSPAALTNADLKSVHGVLQETHPSQFLTMTVKLDNGLTYEFLLLDHFENAERVYEEPAKARGLAAEWRYEEREYLDPYTRSYKSYRVLRAIKPDM
jgi:hypothetical protein